MGQKVWVTIAAIAAILAVGTLSFLWMYNTAAVPKSPAIEGRVIERVSDKSQEEIVAFIKKESIVIGASIVKIDLIKNKRSTIFLRADDENLLAAWNDYIANRSPSPPVFKADNLVQNQQVANLFNGNFVCLPFDKTVNYQFWPKGAEAAPWICSSSIPPIFDGSSDFSGFMNLFLARKPSEVEKQRLAKTAMELAKDIYRRDVENSPAN